MNLALNLIILLPDENSKIKEEPRSPSSINDSATDIKPVIPEPIAQQAGVDKKRKCRK